MTASETIAFTGLLIKLALITYWAVELFALN